MQVGKITMPLPADWSLNVDKDDYKLQVRRRCSCLQNIRHGAVSVDCSIRARCKSLYRWQHGVTQMLSQATMTWHGVHRPCIQAGIAPDLIALHRSQDLATVSCASMHASVKH